MTIYRYISTLLIAIALMATGIAVPVCAQQPLRTDIRSDENIEALIEQDDIDLKKDIDRMQPLGIRYTKKHPLVIVADWTFKPFAYVNDRGEPDGFQIQLIKHIFERMHVAHEIRMMEWKAAKREIAAGHAHLMIDIYKNDCVRNVGYGRTSLAPYKVGIIHKKETEGIRSIQLIKPTDTIYVNKNDYAHLYLMSFFRDKVPFHVMYMEPTEAIQGVVNGKVHYYMWGMSSINSLVNKLGIQEEVYVDGIDIPDGNFRFTSSDKLLLHELDKQFLEYSKMDSYKAICDEWLSGKYTGEKSGSMFEIVLIVTLLLVIVFVVIGLLLYYRSGYSRELKTEFKSITRMSIDITKCHIILMNVRKMWIDGISTDLLPEGGCSLHDWEAMIHPDDIISVYDIRKSVDSGNTNLPVITFRIRKYGDTSENWRMMKASATVKSNRYGNPLYVYLTLTDETERIREQESIDRVTNEFSSIVDIPEDGMAFYDTKGVNVSINGAMRYILGRGGSTRVDDYIKRTNLQDTPFIGNGITLERDMHEWFCTHVEIPELNLHSGMEVRIYSIYDQQKLLKGYMLCVYDHTDFIKQHQEDLHIDRTFDEVKESLKRYQMELRFVLRHNKMHTFRWRKGSDCLEISRDLLSFDVKMSLSDFFKQLLPEYKEEHQEIISDPEGYFSKPHNNIMAFSGNVYAPSLTKQYAVMMMPDYDNDGNFIGAFGILRDISHQQNTLNMLAEQTAMAEDSNRQKALFLANMTHELRTPLNAINGFAELLKLGCEPEERKEYLDIMIHNCQLLIALVDNILQLSTMDMEGIKLHKTDVDFAKLFPQKVEALSHYITSPDVKLIIDRTCVSLPLTVDMEHIMQVMDAFVSNAAKFTKRGYIRAGYRYDEGHLTVYCRDTGCGIAQKDQQNVFKRFVKLNDYVQGTGLGLAVSKLIVESMNGTIEIYSQPEEGTIVSFTIPATAPQ